MSKIPDIEGGYYMLPTQILHQQQHEKGTILTLEYPDGSQATGLMLTGKNAEDFERRAIASGYRADRKTH